MPRLAVVLAGPLALLASCNASAPPAATVHLGESAGAPAETAAPVQPPPPASAPEDVAGPEPRGSAEPAIGVQPTARLEASTRSADRADEVIRCRTRDDCGCTRHYTPTRARGARSATGAPQDDSPGDCIVDCRDGRCTAAQGPM